jgi:hypothetical protein
MMAALVKGSVGVVVTFGALRSFAGLSSVQSRSFAKRKKFAFVRALGGGDGSVLPRGSELRQRLDVELRDVLQTARFAPRHELLLENDGKLRQRRHRELAGDLLPENSSSPNARISGRIAWRQPCQQVVSAKSKSPGS